MSTLIRFNILFLYSSILGKIKCQILASGISNSNIKSLSLENQFLYKKTISSKDKALS